VAELRPHLEEASRKGANVAIIGNGLPAMAKDFARRMSLGGGTRLLTDPRRESYRRAGFRHGFWATLGPRVWPKLLGAVRRFGVRRTQGDPWQQGGTMVLAKGGEVLFRYVSRRQGDRPPPGEVVAALARS
jgi:alkyl-hydroperoxide reductase/thiol specific antioxidant family protein